MPTIAEQLQAYLAKMQLGQPNAADTTFDPQYEQGVRENTMDLTRTADRYTQEGNEDQIDQTRQTNELGTARDESLTRLSESMADRGILRSGATLTGTQKVGESHTKSVDELGRSIQGRANNRQQNFLDKQTNFQSAIERLKLDKAQRQAETAKQKAFEEAETKAKQEDITRQQQEIARQEKEQADALQAAQPQVQPTGDYAPAQSYSPEFGAYQDPNTPEWQAQNASKPDGASLPEWQRMGFPSQESFNAAYRR